MSSKATHSFAGLVVGAGLVATLHPSFIQAALLLISTQMGASAPDWLEVPVWTSRHRFLGPTERVRHSLIPHRTLTHSVAVWAALVVAAAYFSLSTTIPMAGILVLGFCAAVVSHLVLDIRTPMGIPLWPFGRRYRFVGLRCNPVAPYGTDHH